MWVSQVLAWARIESVKQLSHLGLNRCDNQQCGSATVANALLS